MKKRKQKILISLTVFLIALLIPFDNFININIFNFTHQGQYINSLLFVISYLFVGLDIIKKALRNIRRGKVMDENFLMTIATIGAFLLGELPEAVAVMLFYQIGELFQSYAVAKSRKSIASLMDIRPDYANLTKGEKVTKVSPEEVKVGDIILIKPGEKVPLDGIIVEGSTSLDTSSLTGEPIPRDLTTEDQVLSGSINLNGVIKVKVTTPFEGSTVQKILNLVENASSQKSNSENFITKFARVYTPIVVYIALFIVIFMPLLTKESFTTWAYRGLSFLVVSCPCALVISIPLSFFSGLGAASKMGILIKGSNYLEALSKVNTIVFDKTGTLTKGTFTVQEIKPTTGTQEELLSIAAHAENYSTHPIAQAIKTTYNEKIDETKIKDLQELPGLGIKAKINNQTVLVGNDKLMTEHKIKFSKTNEPGTIIHIAVQNQYQGYLVIADEPKDDATQTIASLKQNHIQTIMLTGDRAAVGKTVAEQLKIDEVYTDLLPQDKVNQLQKILTINSPDSKVAFVGDGINDAPVLALADVGIAMGGLGSDSAIEASDIVIMTDEPSKIINAIKLSHKTMRIVKENIIFALLVKITVLVLAALGLSTMWAAVFADVGVSVIAILNALRLLKTPKNTNLKK